MILEFILNISNIPQDCERKSVNLGCSLELVLNILNFSRRKPEEYRKTSWKFVELLKCRFLETSQSEYSKFRVFPELRFEYFRYSSSFQEEVCKFRVILELRFEYFRYSSSFQKEGCKFRVILELRFEYFTFSRRKELKL